MTPAETLPLSMLERERKDNAVRDLQDAVAVIVGDADHRWSEAELLKVSIATQELKQFILRGMPNG